MNLKSEVSRNCRGIHKEIIVCVLLQIFLASLLSVNGCFPYHRGKVETSIVKLEHIDKVRLITPYTSSGNMDQGGGGGYRQAPNVSVIVNFILPNSDKKEESAETKAKNGIQIDKRLQVKLAETVNKVLYGQHLR